MAGDYDGDGVSDPAIYRSSDSTFYYLGSFNNPFSDITFVQWGLPTDLGPAPGDFDGDGKADFCIKRNVGGQMQFILLRSSDSQVEFINWGLSTDKFVPGDFDGDGRDDFTVVRDNGGQLEWYILHRDGGGTGASPILWGLAASDHITAADYDGDGIRDIAIWREDAIPANNNYFIRRSSDLALEVIRFEPYHPAKFG